MHPIVLFDGVCRFCNGGVNWLIDRDRAGTLRFAALQSEAGQRLLTKFGLPRDNFDTMVLVEGDRQLDALDGCPADRRPPRLAVEVRGGVPAAADVPARPALRAAGVQPLPLVRHPRRLPAADP